MWLVAVGLGLLVVWLAAKSPDPNTVSTPVGPNDQVPALGSVGNPSPATAGGSPTASTLYRTALTTNYRLPGNAQRKITAAGDTQALNAPQGTFVAPSATVAEMSKQLMTQSPPQLPGGGKVSTSRDRIKL